MNYEDRFKAIESLLRTIARQKDSEGEAPIHDPGPLDSKNSIPATLPGDLATPSSEANQCRESNDSHVEQSTISSTKSHRKFLFGM